MSRMNWKTAEDSRRMRRQGAETVGGLAIRPAAGSAPGSEPTNARRKAPPIAEPKIIDRWWKNRAHDAVYVRLTPFKEHTLIDIRVWVTPADGITRPGKGFSCTVKHLPRLHAALVKAMAEARALGLIDDEGER
jgi:hypothetical protein